MAEEDDDSEKAYSKHERPDDGSLDDAPAALALELAAWPLCVAATLERRRAWRRPSLARHARACSRRRAS